MIDKPTVGFIGQGFIGKHLADYFESQLFSVVRYSLEEPYVNNRAAIGNCKIVFIAVPTPTTPDGFDLAALETVLPLIGRGNIAVIKSTVLPGSCAQLQAAFPEIIILHAPEFLREKTVLADTIAPERNIIGLTVEDDVHIQAAEKVLAILPRAPYEKICRSVDSEIIKYGSNCFLAMKVVFMNVLFDAAAAAGADYTVISEAMAADKRIGSSHMNVVDRSGHSASGLGRGAGGHCFPKDLAAWRQWYAAACEADEYGQRFLLAIEQKNNSLLRASGKDVDLLELIYGDITVASTES